MKESDIRPAEILNTYLRLSVEDAGRFFRDRSRFRHRSCPGCAGVGQRPAFVKNGFELSFCSRCGSLYVDPIPDDADLAAFYRDSPSQRYWATVFFPSVAETRRQKIFGPRVERLRGLMADAGMTPRRVVDVGAGSGIFLEECRARGFGTDLAAVEPNSDMARTCREKGFEVFSGFGAEAGADSRWAGKGDLVVSFEVIEHVADPASYVNDLARLARPGGHVVVSGLCGTGFDIAVLGAAAKAIAPPHHLNFLSRVGVEALVERCRLELISFLTPGQLDVDILANTLAENPGLTVDRFARHLACEVPASVRQAFQEFLIAHGLSSHMWVIARRRG